MEDGISGRFIPSKANQTGVFLMARCSSTVGVISTEPLITAERRGLGLVTSSLPHHSDDGRGGELIASKANQTGVFLMARCSSTVGVISTEPLITAGRTALALFTSCLPDLSVNGRRGYFIASKAEPTVTAPSAISFLMRMAISMGLRVKVVWAVALSLS